MRGLEMSQEKEALKDEIIGFAQESGAEATVCVHGSLPETDPFTRAQLFRPLIEVEVRFRSFDQIEKFINLVKRVRTVNEPVALEEARRIAAEYAEPNSQIDSGNLYWALCEALKYAAPVEPVKQEPVAEVTDVFPTRVEWLREVAVNSLLYAAPVSAKREWVDLTPIELAEAFSDKGSADAGIRAVITAFKEKNRAQ